MGTPFDLLLFSTEPGFAGAVLAAGAAGVMIDWERRGKRARQAGAATEINGDTRADLERMRAATRAWISCRLNPVGRGSEREIEDALAAGADELFLPMVRSPAEVERALRWTRERAHVAILVETSAALRRAAELARLPVSRVYVGLNDLAIERRSRSLFEPLVDGTLDEARAAFAQPFGFGGLTLPERGSPIPCRLLIGEMARLGCRFSFLRRSFRRDVAGCDPGDAVPRLLAALEAAARRSPEARARDRRALLRAVRRWPAPIVPLGSVLHGGG
jgi:hypothetical protein